jgi:nitrogen fixation protein NifT
MKIMVRRTAQGLSLYVAKKDLEVPIVAQEKPTLWGGTITAANGWVFQLPDLAPDTRLPLTVDATRLSGAEAT